jgi:hypothetical protein
MLAHASGLARATRSLPLWLVVGFSVVVGARVADAYDAWIQWDPVDGAIAYNVYVAHADGAYEVAAELGQPPLQADGSLGAVVRDIVLIGDTRFEVSAVGTGGEGPPSNEILIDYATAARVADSDGDGLTDAEEDVDLDGVVDPGETDPHLADTDGDGLSDSAELLQYHTNPLAVDTDGDGVSDRKEIETATDPLDALSSAQIWVVAATDFSSTSGAMTTSQAYTAGDDSDPVADSLSDALLFANSTSNTSGIDNNDFATYAIDVAADADWYAWGRFYYPGSPGSNDANSFFLRVDGGSPLKFGNNLDYFQTWHWDGDGQVETGALTPLPLGYLTAGTHVLTIEKREVVPIPPRLDVFVLTPEPDIAPTDDMALAGLERPAGGVLPGETSTTSTTLETVTTTTSTTTTSTTTTTLPVVSTTSTTSTTTTSTTTSTSTTTTTIAPACSSDAACDDGDACNGQELCDATLGCVAGTPPSCDDGVYCNGAETCDPAVGCRSGVPVYCEGLAGQCETAYCDEASQSCRVVAQADGSSCDDGLDCTTGDACVAGVCDGSDACPSGEVCSVQTGLCELGADADNDGLQGSDDPCPNDARNLCFGPVAVDLNSGLPIRVNAGDSRASCSGRRTTCDGTVWYEDFGYQKKLGASQCSLPNGCELSMVDVVFGCEDTETDDLFRCNHTARHGRRPLAYEFAVPPGRYVVNLLFANNDADTTLEGDRVFDIVVDGDVAYPDFDQVSAAGGSGTAVVRSIVADVLDGNGLRVELRSHSGQVTIAAIEVLAEP